MRARWMDVAAAALMMMLMALGAPAVRGAQGDAPEDEATEAADTDAPPEPDKPETPKRKADPSTPELVPELLDPPAEAINPRALDRAARTALAKAVDAVLHDLGDEEPPVDLVFLPRFNSKVIDTKTIEVRYKLVQRKVPIWKHEKVTEEVLVPVREGTDIKLKRVTRHRTVRRIKVGERIEEKLVRDPEGDVVKTETVQIRGPGGPDTIRENLLGYNGMILWALLKAGVSPEEHEIVEDFAYDLAKYLGHFGIPDTTWDVAWLTIAYTSYPTAEFGTLKERLVRKLLSGQLTDGPGRGLWGPVCVDTGLLARLLRAEQEVAAEVAKLDEVIEGLPQGARLPPRLVQIRQFQAQLASWYAEVAHQGLQFDKILSSFKVEDRDDEFGRGASFRPPPTNYYHERLADLEMTSLAVMALRVAGDHGHLPEEHVWPIKDGHGKPLAKLVNVVALLARTAAAVAAGQRPDGRWHEMNVWQPVTDFDRMNLGSLGWCPELPEKLPSPVTPTATVLGYRTMADLAAIVGQDAIARRYKAVLDKGRMAARQAADEFLATDPAMPRHLRLAEPEGRALMRGGPIQQCALALRLAPLRRWHGSDVEIAPDLYQRVAFRLLHQQRGDGWWGPSGRLWHKTTSVVERFLYLLKTEQLFPHQQHRLNQKPIPPDTPIEEALDKYYHDYLSTVEAEKVGAAYAMLALLEGLRPPVGITWPTGAPTVPEVADATSAATTRTLNVTTSFAAVAPGGASDRTPEPAALLLAGNGPVDQWPEAARGRARAFAEGGGLVILEAPDTVEGRRVLEQARADVFGGLGLTPSRIGPKHTLAEGVYAQPSRTEIDVDFRDEEVAVAYLPIARTARPRTGSLSADQAGRFVVNLLTGRKIGRLLDPTYPIVLDDGTDPVALHAAALEELDAGVLHYLRQGAKGAAAADGGQGGAGAAQQEGGGAPAAETPEATAAPAPPPDETF